MIAELKKLLAECHVNNNDNTVKILLTANANYLIERAREELQRAHADFTILGMVDNNSLDRRLILTIQLLNLARYKIKCPPSSQESSEKKGRKRSSKEQSSPS